MTQTLNDATAMIVQLDLAISERLINDPKTMALFDAYNYLLDSLYRGLTASVPPVGSAGSFPAESQARIYSNLMLAQTALADLGVMGGTLPSIDKP